MNTTKSTEGPVEIATHWGLIILAGITATAAILRTFGAPNSAAATRLDQTTLLYLAAAGVLLLLRQVKTLSMGQLKFELIEKIRDRQDKQQEQLADIALILPLLLPSGEVRHIKNLFAHTTATYNGNKSLKSELRRLRTIGLLTMKQGRTVGEIKDDAQFDLGGYVELTELGRRWASRIQELEGGDMVRVTSV